MLDCSLPAEVILFLACVLDGSYEVMFQTFIFNRKCIETAVFDPKFASNSIRNNSAWICTVGIKNNSIFLPLEAYSSASTSIYIFYSGLCRPLPALLVIGIIGSIGDLYSRKLAILIPTVGITLRFWIDFVVANFLPFNLYPLILVGDLLYGFCGGWFGFEATCWAYVAHQVSINSSEHASSNEESTPILQEKEAHDSENSNGEQPTENFFFKNVRLALLEALSTIGLGMGFLLGGIFVAILGTDWSFGYLVCLSSITLLLVVFGVRDLPKAIKSEHENLPVAPNVMEQELEKDTAGCCEKFAILLKHPYELMADAYYTVFCKPRPEIGPHGRLVLILIMLCLWIFSICYMVELFIDYLYFTLTPRNFTPFLFGIYSISDSTMQTLSIAIILTFIYYIFRNQDPIGINAGITVFGIIAAFFTFLVIGLAKSQLVIFLSILLDMFSMWAFSGLRVIIGLLVSPTEVGEIAAIDIETIFKL